MTRKTNLSEKLFEVAQQYIPGGVNSPVRAFGSVGGAPCFFDRAEGAYLVDVDGNHYIDYVGSWGPMIMGHNHPKVVAAVEAQLKKAMSFGAPCEVEIKLAQEICRRVDSVQKVRMVNSGTEATMSAIRLARGVTGRDKIIKFEGCYHGHADSLLVKAGSGTLTFGVPSSLGVPACVVEDTLIATFNDLDSVLQLCESYAGEIAAMIVEGVPGNMNMILPAPEFLTGLREICDQYGIVFIMDEVMTGFRIHPQGAQGLYGIVPDLSTFGKIIGGGMPVGAFGGREEIMSQLAPQGGVYQAGTLSGNPIAMTAGLATLSLLDSDAYDYLGKITDALVLGIKQRADEKGVPVQMNHLPGMFGLFFTKEESVASYKQVMACDKLLFNRFFHESLDSGLYFAPSAFEVGFVSCVHTSEDVERTLDAVEQIFNKIAN